VIAKESFARSFLDARRMSRFRESTRLPPDCSAAALERNS
jgi:hypothetical protein